MYVFFGIFLVLTFATFVLNNLHSEKINFITTKASSAQGTISFNVEGAVCGDGTIDGGEGCDDGGVISGDGCSSLCVVESGYTCSGTPSVCTATVVPPSAGGTTGGGGGGSGGVSIPKFEVDKELVKVVTKVGETFKISFKIINTDSKKLDFKVDSNLEGFIVVSEKEFSLLKSEDKEIFLTFYTTRNTEPGVYVGEISVSSGSVIQKIPVILEVESKKILFDISLDIPSKYKELYPGEELLLQLTLFNLGEVGKVDVSITYFIKDLSGKIVFTKEEIVAVETQASFSRTITLPDNLVSGEYVAIAQTKYGNTVGTSSNIFYVNVQKPFWEGYQQYMFMALAILITIIIIVIVIKSEYRNLKKRVGTRRSKNEKTSGGSRREKVKTGEAHKINTELKVKLGILGEAYKSGLIKKKSYGKGKKRIKSANKKLKKHL